MLGVRARAAFFKVFAYVLFVGVFALFALDLDTPVKAAQGINEQINFQGRLLNAQGATVPDGFYNIQFKIYQDGTGTVAGNPSGTLEWTESHLNNNSQGIQVKNGFLSVQLGAITAFGSSVDWNQDTLWLSINIGNTNATCTPFTSCSPDGEMLPMKRLASTPYALNAGRLNGLTGGQFVQLAQGVQTDATNGTPSIYINKTGTGNLLEFQTGGNSAFLLEGDGDAVFGANANHSLTVATTGAGVAGRSLTIAAGNGGTGAAVNGGDLLLQGGAPSGTGTTGSVIVRSNGSNSTAAFQVQNSSSNPLFVVDTVNDRVGINVSGTPSSTLEISGTLRLSGTSLENYSTPNGTNVSTKINIPNFDPGAFGQIVAMGVPSSAQGTARVISLFDGRTVPHQPTLAVFSPNENNIVGLSWNGANTTGYLTTNDRTSGGDSSALSTKSGDVSGGNGNSGTVHVQSGSTAGGTGNTTGNVYVLSGNGGGTNDSSGNVTIDSGSKTGSGTTGVVNVGITNASNVLLSNASGTLTLQGGTTKLSSIGTATANAAAICRDTSTTNLINCDTNTTGRPFLQGGNSFGATAVLGAADANNLQIITNNVTRATFDQSNGLYVGNGVTAAVPNNFTVSATGSSAAGVAGATLTVTGGDGASATTGSAGGGLALTGGDAGGSGNNAGGNVTLGGGNKTGSGAAGKVLVKNAADSTSAFEVQNAAGTSTVLNVDTTNGFVGVGTATPTRKLDVAVDNSSVNTLSAILRQSGSGDVGVELATGNQNYYMGIDNTDDKFKISSGTASGGLVQMGNGNDTGTTTDSGSSNAIHATKFTAGASGTITKLFAYVANPVSSSPNDQAQMGIYTDNGSGTAPNTLLASSASVTLTGNAWNEFTIASTSVTSGTIYWLAYNSNGTNDGSNNLRYDSGSTGQSVWNDPETFGTWNGTWPGTDDDADVAYTMYANISASAGTDNFSTRLFEMDATGASIFQNSVNSATAFQVQNATNTAILSVNTSNSGVLVAGLLDTITATTLAVGTNNATAISLNKNTSVSGSSTFTVGSGLTSLGGNLDVAGSVAFEKGSDFSTTGSTHNANFGEASYIRLTGVSAQTITGIANGRDGEILTITNAGSQTAILSNNSGSSSAANRIITGSGVDLSLPGGASITLIYDSAATFWRATGGVAGVTTVGAIDSQTKSANGAVIAGTSIYLQTADASNVGLVSTGAQTLAGAKTFSALVTGQAGATVSGGAISLTGNAASSLTTSSGALTLTSAAAATWSTAAGDLTLQAGSGTVTLGTSSTLTNGGALTVTGGSTLTLNSTGANNVSINTGSVATINVGTTNASSIQIGNNALASGTQSIGIGNNNTSGGTTNITIGTGGSATGGTTTLQAKGDIILNTNGTTRATFDDAAPSLYLGNGITAATPNNFTISGTGSTTTAVAGGALTIQGGNATVGNANGGNITLTGGSGFGTGARGLVVVDTPTMTTATNPNCSSNCTINQANVDSSAAVLVNATNPSLTITLPDPTIQTAGRLIYVTNVGVNDFTLSVNGGGTGNTIAMKPNTTATMIWNGGDWTAAGASSSTDLQSAYNNTLTSAGGAELVLNAPGGSADGLTIRNNATTPIVGGILEVQTSIGSNLLSVNNNATEYATNGGAETAGASGSTFPSNTWDTTTGGTVDRWTTAGDNIATGQASVRVVTTTTNHGARNRISTSLTSGLTYSVSFAVRGATNFSTLQVLYSPDGTTTGTTQCATAQVVTTGIWTRITCSFVASGTITSSNSMLIRQTDATGRTFYLDNLSININASATFAADGSVDNAGAFTTNWTDFDGGTGSTTITRETTVIYDTSASTAGATTANANQGIRNNMAITPSINTQYLVSFYARSTNTMTSSLAVGFLPAGGTTPPSGTAACTDYNTQSLVANTWTKITCLFTTTGTAISNADLVIYQTDATARTIYVDALSITLNTNNSSNVQIGGGNKGGPATLFTLDRSSSAPIANNNDAYLGSMYYDTSSGRIQCYEADGWGACGAAPDNIVNLNPEYAGAVLNGGGVGTMTADFCSNDTALSVNTTLCSTGQAKNFYRWTSPQPTQQTYSIYVTYQLPATFNGFSSDDTVQLTARVDNTTNASVTYEMYKSTGSAVTQCGTGETNVITGGGGSANTWYSYGINGNEATGCSFNSASAGNLVIFKINVKANSNANAYVSTLTFTTTGR